MNSVVRSDSPDMTPAVELGRKALNQAREISKTVLVSIYGMSIDSSRTALLSRLCGVLAKVKDVIFRTGQTKGPRSSCPQRVPTINDGF